MPAETNATCLSFSSRITSFHNLRGTVMLTIAGEVAKPRIFHFDDLAAVSTEYQVNDVSRLVPGRKGDAVRLAGILDLVQPKSSAKYLGLHSSTDDFHASIP